MKTDYGPDFNLVEKDVEAILKILTSLQVKAVMQMLQLIKLL